MFVIPEATDNRMVDRRERGRLGVGEALGEKIGRSENQCSGTASN